MKKLIGIALSCILALALSSCANDTPAPPMYTIGSTGPGGGIIYKYDASTGKGMEVSDKLGSFTWNNAKTEAQKLIGGVSGWYLPSKDELNEVYVALKKDKNPPLIDEAGALWSSSEYSEIKGHAWYHFFGNNAYQAISNTTAYGDVRAIRAFNILSL